MSFFRIKPENVTQVTEYHFLGKHPIKGSFLFARKDIPKGTVIGNIKRCDYVKKLFKDFNEFKSYINNVSYNEAQYILSHSIPTKNGEILMPYSDHWATFHNHFNDPNISEHTNYFTNETWECIAIKDIKKGDEICVNYNDTVGYEKRLNELIVKQFLNLCKAYDVNKIPSTLTMKPLKAEIIRSKL